MDQKLLTLREVAAKLGVSEQRVYQMDAELHPIIQPRGTKTKIRWYKPDVIEAVRAQRERDRAAAAAAANAPAAAPVARSKRELNALAADIAARALRTYANTAPFFAGVTPEETAYVKERIIALADRLGGQS